MPTEKQRRAARKNIKRAAKAAQQVTKQFRRQMRQTWQHEAPASY